MGIVPAHSTHTVRFTILKPLWLIRENVLSLSLEGDVIVGVIVSRKHSLSMEKHLRKDIGNKITLHGQDNPN